MSEKTFKVGDRVRVVKHNGCTYTSEIGEEGVVYDGKEAWYAGLYSICLKLDSGKFEPFRVNDLELIPQGKPCTINGKTYYAFPEGKTIKELGIDTSRKFILVYDGKTSTGCCNGLFATGDILKLDRDDDSVYPCFTRTSDCKNGCCGLCRLSYYDEEVEEEELEASVREHYGGRCAIQQIKESNNLIKPTGNKFMSNIVKFAKDAALAVSNPDEKLRREVGLKDESGNWTGEAMEIVFSLESQALGYKDTSDMVTTLGIQGGLACTAFELHALFAKYDEKLLEIAKAKKAEDKK